MFKEHFEDCQIGDTVRSPGGTITETDIVNFAAFSGDWNSMHVDQEYARTTPFGQRVAHGFLGMVVGVCLLGRLGWFTLWPRSMIGIAAMDKVRFTAPVFIGDTLYLDAEIVEMRALPPNRGLITTRMCIVNQREEPTITLRLQIIAGCRSDQVQQSESCSGSRETSDAGILTNSATAPTLPAE